MEPSQDEAEPLRLLPRPECVTLEKRAFLSEVALSSAQAEQDVEEAGGLIEGESSACAVAPTMASLSETEYESTLTMETRVSSLTHQVGRAAHRQRRCQTLSPP